MQKESLLAGLIVAQVAVIMCGLAFSRASLRQEAHQQGSQVERQLEEQLKAWRVNLKQQTASIAAKAVPLSDSTPIVIELTRPDVLPGLFGVRQGRGTAAVEMQDKQSLFTKDRFDLMPKLMYAESFLSGAVSPWARYVYVEHERVLNGLKEDCHGREGWECQPKIGAAAFTAAFDQVLLSIQVNGFRSSTRIPIHVILDVTRGNHTCIVDGDYHLVASYALDKNHAVPTLVEQDNQGMCSPRAARYTTHALRALYAQRAYAIALDSPSLLLDCI